MANCTRGELLARGATPAGVLGLDWLPGARAAAEDRGGDDEAAPDLVLINGSGYTVDDSLPRAEAFAVKHGRFVAVGSTSDIRNLASRSTRVLDAAGMTVTPGFIDSHTHVNGVAELVNVPATRRDLDEAVPDHPAMLARRGGHTGVYNTKAFEMAGVTARTPSPDDGRFYVADGELTGLVASRARSVFDGVGRRMEITRETRQAGVKPMSERMTAAGITSFHQTAMGFAALVALQDAHRAGELRSTERWPRTKRRSRAPSQRANSPTSSCSGRTRTRSIRIGFPESRSCARSWEAKPCTRPERSTGG